LEQHGPYLPAYADGFANERLARHVAEAIAARPGWVSLMYPSVPIGTGGANEIGRQYEYPGTHAVRSETLRAVFMDLGSEFGEQGFRWIFVVHGHGAPNHNRALDDAGLFFRDTYGGTVVHLAGLLPVVTAGGERLDSIARRRDGFSVHAGVYETGVMLFLRPDLVPPAYKTAVDHHAADWTESVHIARETTWPGYFGSPALATAAQGAAILRDVTNVAVDIALRVLDGFDYTTIPRLGDLARNSLENAAIDADALRRDAAIASKQLEWLANRRR
jgi:creatinine amidohydrolase